MYSSIEDVRKALTPGGSAADTSTAASLDEAQIVDAIKQADSIIDSHVLARYTIPMNGEVAVDVVRFWSRDIAAYLATLSFKRNKNVPVDEPVRLRFNVVMAGLVAIRDGKATVNLPAIGAETGEDGVYVINQYEGTMFGPEDFGLVTAGYRPGFHIWPGGT